MQPLTGYALALTHPPGTVGSNNSRSLANYHQSVTYDKTSKTEYKYRVSIYNLSCTSSACVTNLQRLAQHSSAAAGSFLSDAQLASKWWDELGYLWCYLYNPESCTHLVEVSFCGHRSGPSPTNNSLRLLALFVDFSKLNPPKLITLGDFLLYQASTFKLPHPSSERMIQEWLILSMFSSYRYLLGQHEVVEWI